MSASTQGPFETQNYECLLALISKIPDFWLTAGGEKSNAEPFTGAWRCESGFIQTLQMSETEILSFLLHIPVLHKN